MAMTREVPLRQGECALLVIDMQRYCAEVGAGYHRHLRQDTMTPEQRYVFDRIADPVVPAIRRLQAAFRARGAEIVYTYIESLTQDGRDQSLDYKISNLFVPKGSPEAKVIEPLAPAGDEILIPKTSCSVFCSTNIEYVLRNLGVTQLVIVGMVTNQCVESAVRDAADKGFLVTVVEDGCAANSKLEHDAGLRNMKGFARICSVATVETEVLAFENK